MAKWISYEDWLKKNGLSRSAANAANWTRQYGPNGVVARRPESGGGTGVSTSAGSSWDVTQGNHNAPAAAAAAAAVPAQAPPPPAAASAVRGRTDAGRESEILNLYSQQNELPARYNIQRNRAATGTRSGLLDAGYFDNVGISSEEAPSTARKTEFKDETRTVTNADGTTSQVVVRTPVQSDYAAGEARPEGNVTYKLSYGPDGRLYRQAYVRAADAFASRGVFSSSLLSTNQRQSRQSLDTARDQSIRNYNNTVDQIAGNQQTDTTNLDRQISTNNSSYTQWTGQQDATLPQAAAGSTPSQDVSGTNNVTTPPPASSTPPAGNLGTWTVRAAGANAIPRLTRQVRERNRGVSFRIVRRGDRYVAVRT